jgi:hypothetical protein
MNQIQKITLKQTYKLYFRDGGSIEIPTGEMPFLNNSREIENFAKFGLLFLLGYTVLRALSDH